MRLDATQRTLLIPLYVFEAVAALLGAILVRLADTVGRTVIAPAQIPAGLMTAMIGTPYFVWLLWRSRTQGARS